MRLPSRGILHRLDELEAAAGMHTLGVTLADWRAVYAGDITREDQEAAEVARYPDQEADIRGWYALSRHRRAQVAALVETAG